MIGLATPIERPAEGRMASSLLLGVNLAGAEFGWNVPGVFGTDYTYPTHTEIDYYAAKGMSVVRLPFLWERVQHSEQAPLDAAELGRLDDVVNYATGKGLKIEIEPHNYGYGFGALIGSPQTPIRRLRICGASWPFTTIQSRRHLRLDERAARPVGERVAWICQHRNHGHPQHRGGAADPGAGQLLGRSLDMDHHG